MSLGDKEIDLKPGTPVKLCKALPLGFGNKKTVPEGATGFLSSGGFVAGLVEVTLKIPGGGIVHAKFNHEDADKYLEIKK